MNLFESCIVFVRYMLLWFVIYICFLNYERGVLAGSIHIRTPSEFMRCFTSHKMFNPFVRHVT